MMKSDFYNRTLRSLLSLAFLLLLYPSIHCVAVVNNAESAKAASNSFEKPDFAYPKTVAENAKVALEKARNDGNNIDVVRALIQYTIATDLQNAENAADNAAVFEDAARQLPAPYSALARLLEAQIYKDVYCTNSYQFNNRSLPLDTLPKDLQAWSGEMFRMKIKTLGDEIFAEKSRLAATPIQEIAPLLTSPSKKAFDYYPSVLDFLTLKFSEIVMSMGMERDGSLMPDLWKELAEINRSKGDHYAQAIDAINYYDLRGDDSKPEDLLAIFEDLKDEPASMVILSKMSGIVKKNALSEKDYYAYLKSAVERWPDGKLVNNLKNQINELEAQRLKATYPELQFSTKPIEVTLESRNINTAYLHIFSYEPNLKRDSQNYEDIFAKGKYLYAKKVEVEGIVPFSATDTVTIDNPGYGYYVVIPSVYATLKELKSEIESRQMGKSYVDPICVSDFAYITTNQATSDQSAELFLVNAHNQKPVKDASIQYCTKFGDDRKISRTVTDANGAFTLPKGSYKLMASKDGDSIIVDPYIQKYEGSVTDSKKASIFTDLALYHPGDSCRFSMVAYSQKMRTLQILSGMKLKVLLIGANGEEIETLTLATDEFGRANGAFKLPESALLGTWIIKACEDGDDASIQWKYLGVERIEVAEYKAPTFFVEYDPIQEWNLEADEIKVVGHVMTYSGMPVANASVDYKLNFQTWWRFWNIDPQKTMQSGKITTNADGSFEVGIPTELLKKEKGIFGVFNLNAAVTSPTGETVTAPSVRVPIGRGYKLQMGVPSKVTPKDNQITLDVYAHDMLDNEAEIEVEYTLIKRSDDQVMASGKFITPSLVLPSENLPSALYILKAKISGEDEEASTEFILYRPTDKAAPEGVIVWVPKTSFTAEPDQKRVAVTIGGIPDSYILAVISNSDGIIERKWLHVKNDNLKFEVDAPAADQQIRLALLGMHNREFTQEFVTIYPPEHEEQLLIERITFRDKILPDAPERWTFRVHKRLGASEITPVMAVMTDKALNSITPFRWSFYPRSGIAWVPYGLQINQSPSGGSTYISVKYNYKTFGTEALPHPEWNFYGYQLVESPYTNFSRQFMAGGNIRGAKMAMREDVADGSVNSMVVEDLAAEESASTTEEAPEEISPVECPLAFFMPNLLTNADGDLEIAFDAPNFNTTWQLQILGYTKDLYAATMVRDVVAAKPLMAKMNLPRFLHIGDEIILKGSLMNNSDEEVPVEGSIELFNVVTGAKIASQKFEAKNLASKGMRTVTMPIKVDFDVDYLGVRIIAKGGAYSDGEQGMIAILPATTPVLSTKNFYLNPGQNSFDFKFERPYGGNAVFTYCDNPAWLCVNALPAMSLPETNASVLTKVRALFGNSVGYALAQRYPGIGNAINYWEETKAESPLLKDADLKILETKNTIWVDDANSETLRMSRLSTLLNSTRMEQAISDGVKDLSKLQQSDGSWAWCEGMPGSQYITARVLLNLSMIRMIGENLGVTIPNGETTKMEAKAVKYCDKELYDSYVRWNKTFSTTEMLNYLYVRSFVFPNYTDSKVSGFSGLAKKAMQAIEKEWKSMDIYDKATAAILMNRYGKNGVASQIIESLRQYATEVPNEGMRFANLRGDTFSQLITSTQALEAFKECAPQDPMVNSLRQWLLVNRQAQNWGTNPYTAEVIYAILSTGENWIADEGIVEFRTLDGQILEIPAMAKYTGECRIELPETVSEIVITRTGKSPAWGGVVMQYVAPILEVKAEAIPDLSISKEIVNLNNPGKQLNVGDKVRVTLTLRANKNIQYVAVQDDRGAYLEPVDQLSSYYCNDNVWMYKEVRNTCTNLMISTLPKGTHVISYECYVTQEGDFCTGIATAQSLYAPTLSAHSAGELSVVN